jgi:hypothetical protein
MNFAADEIALTQKFATDWAASAYAAIPVDYPGKKSDPIAGEIVRFRIQHAPSRSSAVGDVRRRNFGSVLVQIVLPSGQGQGKLVAIADVVSNMFHRFKSGGLRCRPASLGALSEDSSFIMGTVDVPYFSDYSA